MAIQHADIPNAGIHEPKGASGALVGQVYIADGAGSGVWTNSLTNPSELKIDRLLDAISLAAAQQPSAVDTPIQIEFGAAQLTAADPVSISALGVISINETGTYRIKVSFAVGRTGSTGVSEIYARALVNGTPAGQTVHFKIGSSDSYIAYSDEAWLTLPAGTTISYQLIRDSTGNNSGGIFSGNPATAGWADNPSAAIRVERWTT
tara:strand:- start:12603 stop:13220 length:618 start_codon:yes stop_codon:yes gene_type:complete